ncbi:MAG TPA: tetratricopeptide repeat protein [Bacteroidia bacterium]|jgi:tetratricopeptide (TPR) repeat protein|nr:tetratricopeptide repeat protein [Bacteroidia bacterium]
MLRKQVIISSLSLLVFLIAFQCKEPTGNSTTTQTKKDTLDYLNHSDTAKYVGMNQCKLCHQSIYNSFIKTGMGKSFDVATKQKSVADFSHPIIYDKYKDFYYLASWKNDSLFFTEFRLIGKDTVFKRVEQVNYIVGSGQHTNSHIQSVNGYLNQMPMTFYAQKHKWDLPPGFEEGHNTHFSRKIGLECMSCHNSYPNFVLGSENKYNGVQEGINCERCHGPGSIHVAQRSTGSKIDTANYIDYSIVNPSKLSIDRQFDVCQRCHLQGNAILKEGKSFFDFKPGMKLSDYLTVFLPKYKNADDEFIMASHADRLKQSQCFIKSYEKAKNNKSLKPYKDALTCVTCHNPHISVRETNKEVFNDACRNCHNSNGKSKLLCTDPSVVKIQKSPNSELQTPNCTKCHMPSSGSTDIPHVTVHDHYIRKPITKAEKDKIKTFIGLYAVNEKNPGNLTKAWAYINQYDKFEPKPEYLDSAQKYLSDKSREDILKNIHALLQLNFSGQNFGQILKYVNVIGEEELYISLTKRSYDNLYAWSAYHIAEAYSNAGDVNKSVKWFEKAVELAPYVLDFRNKLGSAYMNSGKIKKAQVQFDFMIKENPKNISAYTNLGFIKLSQNNSVEAEQFYNMALKLDPDHEPLLLNLAGLKAYKKDFKGAIEIINQILKKNPGNVKAKMALQQLKGVV